VTTVWRVPTVCGRKIVKQRGDAKVHGIFSKITLKIFQYVEFAYLLSYSFQ